MVTPEQIKHDQEIAKIEDNNKRMLYALDSYNKSVGMSCRNVGQPKYSHHQKNASEAESSQDMWNGLSTSARNKEFSRYV